MSEKSRRPPPGEPWVWLTRELMKSDAWRSRSINAVRLIDFLLVEHMAHGGTANGRLLAPRRQLKAYGIGGQYISRTIEEVETSGLVEVRRGGMRVAVLYALTWLTLHDGTPPSNRWRAFRDPGLPSAPELEARNLTYRGSPGLTYEGRPDVRFWPTKGGQMPPKTWPTKVGPS
ncbi:MAG: hypothetical protein U1E60_29655 [Reyranellaceae bacterium]